MTTLYIAGSMLTITVHDLPAPQGSKRHVGNGVMIESSARVKPWREAVKHAALGALDYGRIPALMGPVVVAVTFTLPRPKGHYRTGRNAHLLRDAAPSWPSGKPDLDKLLRSTLDALVSAAVMGDDALVVHVNTTKTYPGGCIDALPHPGAVIHVYPCPTPDRFVEDVAVAGGIL